MKDIPQYLKVNDYVEIVDTYDEFEGLIGIIEEIFDRDGRTCVSTALGVEIAVWIPRSREQQGNCQLLEVNYLTPYIKQELRLNDDIRLVKRDNLEWVDENDL